MRLTPSPKLQAGRAACADQPYSSYVKRYSYFGAFRSDVSNVGPNAAMLTQKGQLTDIGAWYLGQEATGNKPKGGAAQVAKFAGWAVVVLGAAVWTIL